MPSSRAASVPVAPARGARLPAAWARLKTWLAKRGPAPAADEVFQSYLHWRDACEELRTAYEQWVDCAPEQRILAFHAYRSALDREERLAQLHADFAAAA
jgi:hypothetical protein